MLSSFITNWFCLFIRYGTGFVLGDAILQENGDYLLQETGDKLLLEA